MKFNAIVCAVLGTVAGGAQAQSSALLYGLLDVNVGSFKTNSAAGGVVRSVSQGQVQPDTLNGNRWGLRVSDDLGDGLSALANLESGFTADTGASAQGGVVGLNGAFGTVTLGRNSTSYEDVSSENGMMGHSTFDPSQTNNSPATPVVSGALTAANAAALLSRNGKTWVGYQARFNNSVKYTTPNVGGFTASLTYATGEDKSTPSAGASTSHGVSTYLRYANGAWVVYGAYQSEPPGAVLVTGSANLAVNGLQPALKNRLIGLVYDAGPAKIGAGFNRAIYHDVAVPAALSASGRFDAQQEISLSVAIPLGLTTLSAGVGRSKGNTFGTSQGVGVQALYNLSKRTTLYAGGVSTRPYDKLATAVTAALPGSNIGRVTIYAAGIRHTF